MGRKVKSGDWGRCMPQLFEAQTARTPDTLAVVCEDRQLTYAALNARANQLARHLRRLGVGPEMRVGICMERAMPMAIGILGILKAGGAYVPLDPTYPRERSAFVLRDTQVPVTLTQERLRQSLPEHGAHVVCLDTDWPVMAPLSPDNLTCEVAGPHVAYVIYTSGTTGEPRGVMVMHANLGHYVRVMRLPLQLTPDDVYLHTASMAFSSSVRQLLLPLAHGATVVLATSEAAAGSVSLVSGDPAARGDDHRPRSLLLAQLYAGADLLGA